MPVLVSCSTKDVQPETVSSRGRTDTSQSCGRQERRAPPPRKYRAYASSDFHHVVEERRRDVFEPVRRAFGHDNHIAFLQVARFTSEDVRTANLAGVGDPPVDERPAGDECRRTVEHVN